MTDITHVEGKIDPLADIETIETELMLADLDSLREAHHRAREEGQGQRQGSQGNSSISSSAPCPCCATASRPVFVERKPEEERLFQMLGLLSSKPVLYVCNVEEGAADEGQRILGSGFSNARRKKALKAVVISAKIESEIATFCHVPKQKEYPRRRRASKKPASTA
jgi:ribosome-binding ATPase YchF (GTP1/OBG family)